MMNTAKANRTSIAIIMTQPTIIPTNGLLGGLILVVSNSAAVLTVVVEISELSELSVEMSLVGGGAVLGASEVGVVVKKQQQNNTGYLKVFFVIFFS